MLVTKDTSHWKKKYWLRIKKWKKVFQANLYGPHKQAEVAMLISDKLDFRIKLLKRDNDDHFILIKGTINQKEMSILNTYVPNIETHTTFKKL
jgi:hypothetical protein